MKKTVIVGLVAFITGAVITFVVFVPYTVWKISPLLRSDGMRIQRIVYRAGGELVEAKVHLPSWEELYRLIESEAGVSIQRADLPEQGVSWGIKDTSWEQALVSLPPEGFEVVKTGDKTYSVRPKKTEVQQVSHSERP